MATQGVKKPKSLDEIIKIIYKKTTSDEIIIKDELQNILEACESNPDEWKRYAYFDKNRYTRNLVDDGKGKFTVMIICWGEGVASDIHDHPKSDCFMKILQGHVKETLFDWPKGNGCKMTERFHTTLKENQVSFMDDSVGLHRVENVSDTKCAVSLHIYIPPIDRCDIFDEHTGQMSTIKLDYDSRYGVRT
ncbi:cysteine dioxygenase type 1-like [Entelurus aequoreus]|uniref:cysteine dioxygenase type 1-like n=1 Tax=Entelurus aequoreus TaxID=161455 RepID=UPI002B1E785A|nr:cysteine dioxygenase type 1-like [Entelurus aequoreus]